MHLQGIPDDALIKEFRELDDLIFHTECFGTSDLTRYARLEKELLRRGYVITLSSTLEVTHA
jgi:hypothetical protein